MLITVKSYFNGLVGVGIFGLVVKAVYVGASTADLLSAGIAGVALALLTFHNLLNTFHLNNVDALRNPERRAGSCFALSPLALMRRTSIRESAITALPKSLRFLLDQIYSTGLSSGA